MQPQPAWDLLSEWLSHTHNPQAFTSLPQAQNVQTALTTRFVQDLNEAEHSLPIHHGKAELWMVVSTSIRLGYIWVSGYIWISTKLVALVQIQPVVWLKNPSKV